MLLRGVQIPELVITAWEEGRLVLFSGAGVSMDPPSGLPNFEGLAIEVAERLQSRLNPKAEQWKPQLDALMDLLDQAEINLFAGEQANTTHATRLPTQARRVATLRLSTSPRTCDF